MSTVYHQNLLWNLGPSDVFAIQEKGSWLFGKTVEVQIHPQAPFLKVLQELTLQQAYTVSDYRFIAVFKKSGEDNRYFLIDAQDVRKRLVRTNEDYRLFHDMTELPRAIGGFSHILSSSIQESLQTMGYSISLEQSVIFEIAQVVQQAFHLSVGMRAKSIVTVFRGETGVLVTFRKNQSALRRVSLGEGGFKRVFLAFRIDTDGTIHNVAIAKVKKQEAQFIANLKEEAAIDAMLPNSPYLRRLMTQVTYSRSFSTEMQKTVLVYSLAAGNLAEFMNSMNAVQKKKAIECMLAGTQALHQAKMRHGDLKPANCLVQKDCQLLQLADFGFLTRFEDLPKLGTKFYLAPEGLRQNVNADDQGEMDAWALGVSFCVLLTGQLPFNEDNLWKYQGNVIDDNELQQVIDHFLGVHRVDIENQIPDFYFILHALLRVKKIERMNVTYALCLFKGLRCN